ncbi:MAG: N-acetyltransferase DgcN [Pseudomonadota bacterium]
MELSTPYLLFLGDVPDALAAKTALGIVDWRRDWCVGQWRLPKCQADAGLPEMNAAEGAAAGAKTMIVGVVNAGGKLPEHWIDSIKAALENGMDVATGLHQRLADIPELAEAAAKQGQRLIDVRRSTMTFETGKGTKRPGKRLLTVGTDCSVGKKYTALALEAGMREAGYEADFCATGQTGVFISRRGAAIDAVVADFISGAAEWLAPAIEPHAWQLVEGQGSLFHPSFAGVSLGLLHGAQPDAIVICHEPTRKTMRGVKNPLPTIQEVIDMNVSLGRLTNPDIAPIGIAINTAALAEADAHTWLKATEDAHGLPATDPVRFGVSSIVDNIVKVYGR